MSAATPSGGRTGARRGRSKRAAVPFWRRDLSDMFRREHGEAVDAAPHPPFAPTVPAVNLLPASVSASIRAAHARRRIYVAAGLLVLVAVVIWILQAGAIGQAQSGLDAEKARSIELADRTTALAPVQELNTQITTQREFVQTTLASQPLAAEVMSALLKSAAGANVSSVTSMALQFHGIPAPGTPLNPCPTSDPFAQVVTIGCLTFTATAPSRTDIATLLTRMEANPLFVGPYVASTTIAETETGAQVSFSGTAGISTDALDTPLTDEQLQQILAPPTPEATPSASPTPETGG